MSSLRKEGRLLANPFDFSDERRKNEPNPYTQLKEDGKHAVYILIEQQSGFTNLGRDDWGPSVCTKYVAHASKNGGVKIYYSKKAAIEAAFKKSEKGSVEYLVERCTFIRTGRLYKAVKDGSKKWSGGDEEGASV